ncbi:MAG: CofD-related protein of GAK system [Planctomycetota bacterium]|jgi:CofD-related protein of GAK system
MTRPKPKVPENHTAAIPNPDRVRLYLHLPESGPRLLFFSGGSALRETSRVLKRYTHNSIHLITPFDSGGSSAVLREAFAIFGVGDLRNRLMALADESEFGETNISTLFSHRLPDDASAAELQGEFEELIDGSHSLLRALDWALRTLVLTHLHKFAKQMPKDFDLRGASVGNLILAGGYLVNQRDIDPVLSQFSKLVGVRGIVRPTVTACAHLVALHEGGEQTIGQHLFGKAECARRGRIIGLELTSALEGGESLEVQANETGLELIGSADLLVFPMGSFFGSVLANLLPRQVGRSVLASSCPRVYIPNCGVDPEMAGYSLFESAEQIAKAIAKDAEREVQLAEVLDFVLIDSKGLDYECDLDLDRLAQAGVQVLDLDLADSSRTNIDPQKLTEVLLSMV